MVWFELDSGRWRYNNKILLLIEPNANRIFHTAPHTHPGQKCQFSSGALVCSLPFAYSCQQLSSLHLKMLVQCSFCARLAVTLLVAARTNIAKLQAYFKQSHICNKFTVQVDFDKNIFVSILWSDQQNSQVLKRYTPWVSQVRPSPKFMLGWKYHMFCSRQNGIHQYKYL